MEKISIGGRNITSLRFADDTDAVDEKERELEALIESLDKACTRYKMEFSADDKQRQRHPKGQQDGRTEGGYCKKL